MTRGTAKVPYDDVGAIPHGIIARISVAPLGVGMETSATSFGAIAELVVTEPV